MTDKNTPDALFQTTNTQLQFIIEMKTKEILIHDTMRKPKGETMSIDKREIDIENIVNPNQDTIDITVNSHALTTEDHNIR